MEGFFITILTLLFYASASYVLGAVMHYSKEFALAICFITAYIVLGVLFSQLPVQLPTELVTFLCVSMIFIPMGYATVETLIETLERKMETASGTGVFDELYKKYNAPRFRQDPFEWFDSTNYSAWQEQLYKEAAGGGAKEDDFKTHHGANKAPPFALPEKDRMLAVLGLTSRDASAASIKKAYRKMARKYHPDMIAGQNLSESQKQAAEKKMQTINAAHDWLKENGYA